MVVPVAAPTNLGNQTNDGMKFVFISFSNVTLCSKTLSMNEYQDMIDIHRTHMKPFSCMFHKVTIQTSPEAQPTSCTMGTKSLSQG
jgi:hypothetical protein